jgi:hypothetical protein
MKYRKLAIVGLLGLVVGLASLWHGAASIAALNVGGFLIGMVASSKSESPVYNLVSAIGWGALILVCASIVVGLAKLAEGYASWTWPIPPETAILLVWVGGGLMFLLWLLLGSLIRLLP